MESRKVRIKESIWWLKHKSRTSLNRFARNFTTKKALQFITGVEEDDLFFYFDADEVPKEEVRARKLIFYVYFICFSFVIFSSIFNKKYGKVVTRYTSYTH